MNESVSEWMKNKKKKKFPNTQRRRLRPCKNWVKRAFIVSNSRHSNASTSSNTKKLPKISIQLCRNFYFSLTMWWWHGRHFQWINVNHEICGQLWRWEIFFWMIQIASYNFFICKHFQALNLIFIFFYIFSYD